MIVEIWTAAQVKALRVSALRETQEQFARRIGWQPRTVRKWERAGDDRPMRADRAAALDEALKRLNPEQLQRFTAALTLDHTASVVHSGEAATRTSTTEEDDVRRRELGKLAAVAAAALPVWEHGFQPRIGTEDVRRLTVLADELLATDQRIGGGTLVDTATDMLHRTMALLETCTFDEQTGRHFLSAAGNLAVAAGWLAYDADRQELARRCYADALSLGSAADDEDLVVHACLSTALQATAMARRGRGSPSYVLTMVGRAKSLVRGRPPGRVHALIAAREAGAYGLMDDRSGFDRAMSTAWREMEAAEHFEPITECPTWLRFVTPAEIRGHEARGLSEIGHQRRAIELFELACGEHAGPRNTVNIRAWTAAARVRAGDVTGALHEGLEVLTHLEQSVTSPRTMRTLEPVVAATRDTSAGEGFRARYRALTTTETTAP